MTTSAENRAYYVRNRERLLAKAREHYAENPDYYREYRERRREYRSFRRSLASRARQLGVDPMTVTPQPAACEVCGQHTKSLHLDHDHATGAFRGWLCRGCNHALGNAHDDPALLRKLADYFGRE